ncbi:hypothetical protein, partial [uncultured Duncaniella sp.]|uniref:hypothetical protein n=1 Tax=uncultured Duncaniella sp. TaxID=2768039 RepID=UPI002618B901
ARAYMSTDNPHTFAKCNFALRASLHCRSMRGYDRIAAAQLSNCHPARRHRNAALQQGIVAM